MSGSNGLLDALSHPAQIDYMGATAKANQLAQSVWANRLAQAQQLSGQAQQDAIDPQTGEYDPNAMRRNLAAAGPNAALAAQSGLQANQALSSDQFNQAKDKLQWVGKTSADALTKGDYSDAAMTTMLSRGVADGMLTLPEMQKQLATMPADAAGRQSWLQQHQAAALNNQQLLDLHYGASGSTTGPGGQVIGTKQSLQTGAITSPQQGGTQANGVRQGLSPEGMQRVITITNPDGSETTDTIQGHYDAGRLSYPAYGETAGGYDIKSGSPAAVAAFRGTEGTADGRTSVSGARGQLQVTPIFFKQYALPGESFDNKADVERVGQRGIGQLEAQYPNDPARMATAYFSGPSNVSPPGSALPYKINREDPNHAKTSDYVARFVQRYNAAAQAQGQSPGAQPAAGQQASPAAAAPNDQPTMTPAAAPGPAMGGTTVPAGVKQAVEGRARDSVAGFKDISDQGVQAQSRASVLDNMLTDTNQFTTGPGASAIAKVRAVADRLGIPINTDGLTAAQSFQKLAAQLNGGQGSDARLAVSEASNPHADLSPGGIDMILRQLRGNEDYSMARAKLAAAYPDKTNKTGFEANIGSQLDPRTFQYDRMTGAQKKTYFNNLPDKDAFIKHYTATEKLMGGG